MVERKSTDEQDNISDTAMNYDVGCRNVNHFDNRLLFTTMQ